MGKSTKTRVFEDKELQKFFASFNLDKKVDYYYYHAFRLQYLTALRISDLLNLRKSDISKHFFITEQKTQKRKEVYLCEEALRMAINLAEISDGEHLFTRRNSSSYRYAIKRYCQKAGIDSDRLSTHSLRKTMANKVAKLKGVKVASKLLNHAKMETTEMYLDDSQTSIEQAIDTISE